MVKCNDSCTDEFVLVVECLRIDDFIFCPLLSKFSVSIWQRYS